MSKVTKEPIPTFNTDAQERAYWESHDSSAHVDWREVQKVKLPNLRPPTEIISLHLPQYPFDYEDK